MIMPNDLPKEALDDPFRPPLEPCAVRCLHCNMEYSSSEITWRSSPGGGFWCCPTDGCGGMGFNFDIFPLDSDIWQQGEDLDEDEDIDIEQGPDDRIEPPPHGEGLDDEDGLGGLDAGDNN